MRKDVKKMLFAGAVKDKPAFFKEAQELGIIHFIDSQGVGVHELPEDLNRLNHALKILRSLPVLDQEENVRHLDADAVVDTILTRHHRLQHDAEELRLLTLEQARIAPLGYFSKEDIASLEGRICQSQLLLGQTRKHKANHPPS